MDTIGPSPEKVMTHHGDDYHPAWWMEFHPAVGSERTSENSERWSKRHLRPAEHAIPKHSSATSSMTARIPHPDGLVKPVRQHALTARLSSGLLTTLLSFVYALELRVLNFTCVGTVMSASGSWGTQLRSPEHTASFPELESMFLETKISSACLQSAPQTISGDLAEVITSPYKPCLAYGRALGDGDINSSAIPRLKCLLSI